MQLPSVYATPTNENGLPGRCAGIVVNWPSFVIQTAARLRSSVYRLEGDARAWPQSPENQTSWERSWLTPTTPHTRPRSAGPPAMCAPPGACPTSCRAPQLQKSRCRAASPWPWQRSVWPSSQGPARLPTILHTWYPRASHSTRRRSPTQPCARPSSPATKTGTVASPRRKPRTSRAWTSRTRASLTLQVSTPSRTWKASMCRATTSRPSTSRNVASSSHSTSPTTSSPTSTSTALQTLKSSTPTTTACRRSSSKAAPHCACSMWKVTAWPASTCRDARRWSGSIWTKAKR